MFLSRNTSTITKQKRRSVSNRSGEWTRAAIIPFARSRAQPASEGLADVAARAESTGAGWGAPLPGRVAATSGVPP